MTKEHAYAYEAGYVDGSSHYELEHCPACKNVADLQAALAENEKLREERDHWHVEQVHAFGNWEDAHKHATELEAENAKLRELVSGLEHCVQGFVCDGCPLYDPSGTNHRRCESLERELGIEVDDVLRTE